MSTTFTPGQYVICSSGDAYWRPTAAKTLTAAKTAASRAYQQAAGGSIEVAVVDGTGDQQRFERVAVKRGYSAWQQA